MDIATIIVTACVGAIVGILFKRIEKRIAQIEIDSKKHYEEQVQIRLAERELLLAEAHISSLSARGIRGEKVNGELEKAEKELGVTNEIE